MNIKYWAHRAKIMADRKAAEATPLIDHINWLKEKEREVALQLGAAIADRNMYEHIGFCFGKYDSSCHGCPTEGECLTMAREEMVKLTRRVETLRHMLVTHQNAIEREMF
jgi:hypothetical protein